MPIKFSCPQCQKSLNAPDAKAGAQVACPGCKNPLVVPKPVPPPPRAAVPPVPPPAATEDLQATSADKPKKGSSPLEPVLRTWGTLPTPAKIGAAGGLLFVFVMCCGGLAFIGSRFIGGGGGDPGRSGESEKSAIPAGQFTEEYARNHSAADKKYKGKKLLMSGVVQTTNVGAEGTVELKTHDRGVIRVFVFFDKKDWKVVNAEVIDQFPQPVPITFKCVYTGHAGQEGNLMVYLKGEELISPSRRPVE